jgi:hypothetical protein
MILPNVYAQLAEAPAVFDALVSYEKDARTRNRALPLLVLPVRRAQAEYLRLGI